MFIGDKLLLTDVGFALLCFVFAQLVAVFFWQLAGLIKDYRIYRSYKNRGS